MNKLFLAVGLLISGATHTYAQQYPKATGYINDFAQLLNSEQRTELNDALASFEKETSIEIAVVTVLGLNNQSVEEYAKGIGKEWGVGKQGKNNGVIFLVAPKERKMRIEVASGVSSILTSSRADRIRDQAVLPHFKSGNMAQGVLDGTHAIMSVLNRTSIQTSLTPSEQSHNSTDGLWIGVVLATFVVLPLIIALLMAIRSENRRYVLEKRGEITNRFSQALETAKNPDVKEETRTYISRLTQQISTLSEVTSRSKGVSWSRLREELDSVNFWLGQAEWKINAEIAFAQKAREEGPELFNRIPSMIEEAEGKLANNASPKAVQCLQDAKTQYDQALTHYTGLDTTDWIVLYVMLSNIKSDISHISQAESIHYPSDSGSSDHSSTLDSTHSIGSSGFSGGEGFNGVDGSSGGW